MSHKVSINPLGSFKNYVTHLLLLFDHPPTHSNALVIILLMTYNTRVCYTRNAFANHPPIPAALCNMWTAPFGIYIEMQKAIVDCKMKFHNCQHKSIYSLTDDDADIEVEEWSQGNHCCKKGIQEYTIYLVVQTIQSHFGRHSIIVL